MQLLKLSSGGPYLTSDGDIRYGAALSRSGGKFKRGKDARNPREGGGGGAYGTSPVPADGSRAVTLACTNYRRGDEAYKEEI